MMYISLNNEVSFDSYGIDLFTFVFDMSVVMVNCFYFKKYIYFLFLFQAIIFLMFILCFG